MIFNKSTEHLCKHCNNRKGVHKSHTLQCPIFVGRSSPEWSNKTIYHPKEYRDGLLVEDVPDKFNYAVGHYYEGDSGTIGCYALFGEVRYGTIHHATGFLEYVKSKSPDKKWKIFELREMV